MSVTYREAIYEICTKTDLNDEEDVIDSMSMLADEATKYHDICMTYEDKLKEIMTAKDFAKFIGDVARDMFRKSVDNLPNGSFKDFCNANFDELTRSNK